MSLAGGKAERARTYNSFNKGPYNSKESSEYSFNYEISRWKGSSGPQANQYVIF